jgi:putative IMPACT (imprinted ancient) family translation regulator
LTPRVEKIARVQLVLAVSYALYEGVKRTLATYDHHIDDEDFGSDITITATVRLADEAQIRAVLIEQTAAQIVIL